ncbi:MAG TPA: hypothetical protein P5307_21005 [Pirellulaceae bacterium]|nr:hypothetical protein [Planctomycetales bacterium]MCB9941367.1 hypothetical protein [Planctomycetaceae bacterium]HRX81567.1 hypothetical protein [Pirellulaceae bacterium]
MYGLLILVALGADGVESSSELRPYHEISRELRETLRLEATAHTNTSRAAAIYQLTVLYSELKRDPRLIESETLTSYKNRLWGRLTHIKKDLEREFARADAPNTEPTQSVDEVMLGVTESLSLIASSTGGPAHLLSQVRGAGGGGAVPDYGPGLVALIERTIAPEFWDVAGGPGTIVYYAPLRALVVRATTEVHRDIGGVLGGLRAAGM